MILLLALWAFTVLLLVLVPYAIWFATRPDDYERIERNAYHRAEKALRP